mmetsp:Transcript_31393/g.40394  ORF Transcript_31393/g.40394 Transcript_31393/m.40394 type:complete len:212 (-) Transcript_31393:174-809(-)
MNQVHFRIIITTTNCVFSRSMEMKLKKIIFLPIEAENIFWLVLIWNLHFPVMLTQLKNYGPHGLICCELNRRKLFIRFCLNNVNWRLFFSSACRENVLPVFRTTRFISTRTTKFWRRFATLTHCFAICANFAPSTLPRFPHFSCSQKRVFTVTPYFWPGTSTKSRSSSKQRSDGSSCCCILHKFGAFSKNRFHNFVCFFSKRITFIHLHSN